MEVFVCTRWQRPLCDVSIQAQPVHRRLSEVADNELVATEGARVRIGDAWNGPANLRVGVDYNRRSNSRLDKNKIETQSAARRSRRNNAGVTVNAGCVLVSGGRDGHDQRCRNANLFV